MATRDERQILVDVQIQGEKTLAELARAFDNLGKQDRDIKKLTKELDRLSGQLKKAGRDAKKTGVDFDKVASNFRAMGSAGTLAGDTLERMSILMTPMGAAIGVGVVAIAGLAAGYKALSFAVSAYIEDNERAKATTESFSDSATDLASSIGGVVWATTGMNTALDAHSTWLRQAASEIERYAGAQSDAEKEADEWIATLDLITGSMSSGLIPIMQHATGATASYKKQLMQAAKAAERLRIEQAKLALTTELAARDATKGLGPDQAKRAAIRRSLALQAKGMNPAEADYKAGVTNVKPGAAKRFMSFAPEAVNEAPAKKGRRARKKKKLDPFRNEPSIERHELDEFMMRQESVEDVQPDKAGDQSAFLQNQNQQLMIMVENARLVADELSEVDTSAAITAKALETMGQMGTDALFAMADGATMMFGEMFAGEATMRDAGTATMAFIGEQAAAFGSYFMKLGVAYMASGNVGMGAATFAGGAALSALGGFLGAKAKARDSKGSSKTAATATGGRQFTPRRERDQGDNITNLKVVILGEEIDKPLINHIDSSIRLGRFSNLRMPQRS